MPETTAPVHLRLPGRPDQKAERLALRAALVAARILGLATGTHLRHLRGLADPIAALQARLQDAELRAPEVRSFLGLAEALLGLPPAGKPALSPPRGQPGEGPGDSPLSVAYLDPQSRRFPSLGAPPDRGGRFVPSTRRRAAHPQPACPPPPITRRQRNLARAPRRRTAARSPRARPTTPIARLPTCTSRSRLAPRPYRC